MSCNVISLSYYSYVPLEPRVGHLFCNDLQVWNLKTFTLKRRHLTYGAFPPLCLACDTALAVDVYWFRCHVMQRMCGNFKFSVIGGRVAVRHD